MAKDENKNIFIGSFSPGDTVPLYLEFWDNDQTKGLKVTFDPETGFWTSEEITNV